MPVAGNNGHPWDLWSSCLSKDLNLEALLPARDTPEGSSVLKPSPGALGCKGTGRTERSKEVSAPGLLSPYGRIIGLNPKEALKRGSPAIMSSRPA